MVLHSPFEILLIKEFLLKFKKLSQHRDYSRKHLQIYLEMINQTPDICKRNLAGP